MQNAPREAPRRRTLFCWARLYGTQLARGQLYSELRPCTDVETLGRWLRRAVSESSTEEVLAD